MHHGDDPARRDLLLRLAALPLFAGLDAQSLGDLADTMEWLVLPGGAELFAQGEASDALYVVVHGRLAASRRDEDGRVRALGAVAPGECVGETGLIAGEPRSARRRTSASTAWTSPIDSTRQASRSPSTTAIGSTRIRRRAAG